MPASGEGDADHPPVLRWQTEQALARFQVPAAGLADSQRRRIDAALAEANAKLEAVMNIEREVGPQGKETFP